MIKPLVNKKIQYRRQTKQRSFDTVGGFTLVEMLVSVALVLLMMLMFTEIFQIASSSITAQRGLSENDQRARMLTTLIQSDLNKRTFQHLVPLDPSETATNLSDFTDRRGYLMISENDPANDTDDLIQFTVDATITTKLLDTTPYYGRATVLGGNIFTHPNQPETDDAQISADNTSQSPYAEICYFMRGGNLYRRTLLIRKPLDLETITTDQPQTGTGLSFFDPANALYSGNFWNDFDFSAYRAGSPTAYANFHGLSSFDNTTLQTLVFSLGRPNYRFGFNHATGLPREFIDDDDGNPQFIGRFTHQETSDPNFLYPQADSTAGGVNPMDPVNSSLTLDKVSHVVRQYASVSGSRRAEDLVLSNVVSFDIKLFDDAAGQFVDIGSTAASDYSSSALPAYANNNPDTTFGFGSNIYDTWHIQHDFDNADSDGNFATGADPPPFKPMDTSGAIPVPKPLKAIQIKIRYIDISSQQLRQMTIIQPLVHAVEE